MKILVADDSPTMRRIILRTLFAIGHTDVEEVSSGDDAVTMCEPGFFELALVDWNMPGLSTMDTIKELRKIDPKLKIITIIVESEKGRVMQALAGVADCYIVKPFTAKILQETIAGVCA